jgi:DNA helicase-2/ATP-dependent DNA helicase PcrA
MLVGDLVSLESELSEHLVDPERLRAWDAEWLEVVEQTCDETAGQKGTKGHCDELRQMATAARRRRELTSLVSAYRTAKADLDAIDFGDQVALAARLAETVPEVGLAERERSTVVLLDEYQDTSVAQRRMLVGLFGGGHPVTAVGRPCQAIYGWRGASVSNLDGFPRHFANEDGSEAATFALRSTSAPAGRLLALANQVAGLPAQPAPRSSSCRRRRPRPTSARRSSRCTARGRRSAPGSRRQVKAAVDSGIAGARVRVLVRARSDFADLYAALTSAGLPVEVVGPRRAAPAARGRRRRRGAAGPRRPDRQRAAAAAADRPRGGSDPRPGGARPPARELLQVEQGRTPRPPDETALEQAVAGVDPCDVVALADALDRPGHEGWSVEGVQRVTRSTPSCASCGPARDEPLLDLVHRVVEVTGST